MGDVFYLLMSCLLLNFNVPLEFFDSRLGKKEILAEDLSKKIITMTATTNLCRYTVLYPKMVYCDQCCILCFDVVCLFVCCLAWLCIYGHDGDRDGVTSYPKAD